MRAVVFIGPSLPEGVSRDPSIDLRPPAKAGDIYRASEDEYDVIALVDGRFGDCRAVLHDEILHALARGVHVWGASSLGALRAVECAPFGMRGIGRVFEMYRDGLIEDEDEVALLHGPAEIGSPPLSEPLINIRVTLDDYVSRGIVAPDDAERIVLIAREATYSARSWPALAGMLDTRRGGVVDEVIRQGTRDQKREDAGELLDALRGALTNGLPPVPSFEFHQTVFWTENRRDFYRAGDRGVDDDQAVLDELRLSPDRYSLLADEAHARLGVAAQPTAQPAVWAATAQQTGTGASAMKVPASSIDRALLDDLHALDAYRSLAARALAKRDTLGRDAPGCNCAPPVPVSVVDREIPALLDWFCRSRRVVCDLRDADAMANSLGLCDRRALHQLLHSERAFSELAHLQEAGS